MPRTQHTRKPDPRQPTFEWERGTQLALLRDVRLPRVAGVSQVTLKAVLRSIDDHARRGGDCWATQETVAREIGVSNVRTVKRAIAALLAASLITCERRKVPGGHRLTVNHYRIVWTELALLEAKAAAANKVTLTTNQSDILSDQSDIDDRSTGHGCHLPRSEKKRLLTATLNGTREEAAEEFLIQEGAEMPTKRNKLIERPILAADDEARTAERELGERRRSTQPGWPEHEQDRVRDMFLAAGVGTADDLLQLAIARGLTPADCDAHVEQLHGSVDAKEKKPLGAGALVHRIKQGAWPCNLIAKIDLDKADATVTRPTDPDLAELRKHAERRAANERLAAQAKADRERMQARDDRLGKVLDALPESELQTLIERLPKWCREGVAARYLVARPITFGLIRQELFTLLESPTPNP